MIGHRLAIDLLHRQQENEHVPQALLIVGPPNVGKGTLARFFAQSLCCRAQVKPCGTCLPCHKFISGNHPDIRIFDHDEETLKIETIRELQHDLYLSPVEGQYRVAVLANFERATTSAANALLKTLEEPPPQVVLILTAVNASMLLPTIVSRCQILPLRGLPTAEVVTALQTNWQASPEQAQLLAQLAAGRLGWAVRALEDDSLLKRRDEFLQELLGLLSAHRADRLAYAQKLSQDAAVNSPKVKEALIYWLTMWRDLLLLHSGCQTKIVNLDWQSKFQTITPRLTTKQIKDMINRLQTALSNHERNVNPRLNLEVTLLKLPKLT